MHAHTHTSLHMCVCAVHANDVYTTGIMYMIGDRLVFGVYRCLNAHALVFSPQRGGPGRCRGSRPGVGHQRPSVASLLLTTSAPPLAVLKHQHISAAAAAVDGHSPGSAAATTTTAHCSRRH